jgi:glycosyltransferase involved in cell wall biosynthesis
VKPLALFVDEVVPAVGDSAGASAALDHMRALQRLGFEVSFVATQDMGDGHRRREALEALGIRPLLSPWYASVEEILRRHAGRFDLVYLHRASNASAYGRLVRQYCPRALLVYGVADLHHLRLARQAVVEDRPELGRLAERLRFEELVAARQADVVITHSRAEAKMLAAQLPGLTVATVPWSVSQRPAEAGFAAREGIAFIGNFGHEPNVDAVHWLAREVLPLVRSMDPAIGFRVIGRGMSAALRGQLWLGLELVGAVEDLDAEFAQTRLTVAPLRYGAGLKGKVIESLAAGVPCVGTSIAYEGMVLPPALVGCIADTPQRIAKALLRLYRDPAAHAQVADAGCRYATRAHSEATIDALMQSVVAPVTRRWAGVGEAGVAA